MSCLPTAGELCLPTAGELRSLSLSCLPTAGELRSLSLSYLSMARNIPLFILNSFNHIIAKLRIFI